MARSDRLLPPPLDLSHHLSPTTRNREASSVKDFYKYFLIPGIGNLAGGTTPLPRLRNLPNTPQAYQIRDISHTTPSKRKSRFHSASKPIQPPIRTSPMATVPYLAVALAVADCAMQILAPHPPPGV